MANFNLLPQELAPKESYIRLAAKLKKIAIIGYSIFLVATVTVFFIFNLVSKKVEESSKRESQLLTSIEALKETEQRLILTQDRLSNARNILSIPNCLNGITILKNYVNNLPDNVIFNDATIETGGIRVALSMGSSDDLTDLLTETYSMNVFKQIILTNYSYSQGGRYNLGLKLGI